MRAVGRSLRELWIVLRSVSWNLALFAALLVGAAALMQVCGCYPAASFHERMVNALYLARLESVAGSGGHPLPSILAFLMPLAAILVLGEGALRVAATYLGRRHHRQEWEKLMAQEMSGHVVVCGAGELGRALLEELLRRDPDAKVVVIDTDPGILAELGMHGSNLRHIHGDMTSQETLLSANVENASKVVFTSGDDAHNLEAAYKAFRLNPKAEIHVRLYRIGLSEMMDAQTRSNFHFFSPYQRAAAHLADQLHKSATHRQDLVP